MSTYPTTPSTHGVPVAAPAKPGTLLAALVATAFAGLLAVINGVYVLAVGGAEVAGKMLVNVAADVNGLNPDDVTAQASEAAKGLAGEVLGDQIEGRAFIVLVPAVLVLLFGLLMGKASTGIRVTATIFALILTAVIGWFSIDYGSAAPTLMAITGWGATICALAGVVLMWLPANGRYAEAIKRA